MNKYLIPFLLPQNGGQIALEVEAESKEHAERIARALAEKLTAKVLKYE